MKCPKCDKEINEDNLYCPYCGERLRNHNEHLNKELKDIKKKQLSLVMNRILNISTIVAIVFVIIGMFGPTMNYSSSQGSLGIGGFSWFIYDGWVKLNAGEISLGPFVTSFALYILTFIIVIIISSHALYKAINCIKKKAECQTYPHIICLSILHQIYSAFIANFYYEYVYTSSGYYEGGSGWGETTYYVVIPFFTIAMIAFLIMKAVFSNNPKKIVTHIFVLVSSFALINAIGYAFTSLGFQDIHIGEQDVFGTLHYFDLSSNIPIYPAILIILMFTLGVVYIGIIVTYAIVALKDLIKKDTINRPLLLGLAIAHTSVSFLMVVIDIMFGSAVNEIVLFQNNMFYVNSNLIMLLLTSFLVLGLSIATFNIIENKTDNNIIDQDVIEKHDA